MLKVEGLECRYGKVAAVRGLSIEIGRGELVALIGANGAGKTTTLKAISGLIMPTAGRIFFEGERDHQTACAIDPQARHRALPGGPPRLSAVDRRRKTWRWVVTCARIATAIAEDMAG